MSAPPIVQVRGLTRRFGSGCADCMALTGPERETNQCPSCRSVIACREV